MTLTEQQKESGDFVRLAAADDYAAYFNHLTRVFGLLRDWYESLEGGDDETNIVSANLSMLLETTRILRLRQLHDASRTLALDLNESGFPHADGIASLESDLQSKERRLKVMLPAKSLKQQALDELIATQREPTGLLTLLGERQYLESLEGDKVFLSFNRCGIFEKQSSGKDREYVVAWSSYDFASSRPSIYILAFTYDADAAPLKKGSAALEELFAVIKEEGSRAATLMVVASELDRRIKAVHPKILKRVGLGPIWSKAFAKDRHPLLEVVREYGEPNDFIVRMKHEVIFSTSETQPTGVLFWREKARQVFAVPDTDLECFTEQVSRLSYTLFVPHHVLQKVDFGHPALQKFRPYTKIAFDKEGGSFQV